MIKTTNLGKIINILLSVLALLVCFACSPERDEYSFPPLIYDEAAFLKEISEAGDLISLNETRVNYAVALNRSVAVEEALEQKWQYLVEKVEKERGMIGRLADELELWGFDFVKIGKEQYRIHLLFRVTGKLENRYGISIVGRLPDPLLLPEPYRERGFQLWHIRPLPPTTLWEEGEFIVVREDIVASDLPYELRINLDTSEGLYGNQIPMGTMGKIEEMPISENDVLTENDPFLLSEWLTRCHARTGPIGELVRRRHREIIAELPTAAVMQDEISLLGVRLERTGPGRVRLRLLVRAENKIDRDYWITLYGSVEPEDTEFLSEARRKEGRKSELWYLPTYPPTSSWEAGLPVMVTLDLEVQPIAYGLFGHFYDRDRNEAGPRFEVGLLAAPGS